MVSKRQVAIKAVQCQFPQLLHTCFSCGMVDIPQVRSIYIGGGVGCVNINECRLCGSADVKQVKGYNY